MSDLFEPLRGLAEEPARPLPPDEVRRRGDGLRRRRTALQSLAAACAVAVVATGAAVAVDVTRSDERPGGPATGVPLPSATSSSTPGSTSSPTPTATEPAAPTSPAGGGARIPASFPLDLGLEDVRNDGDADVSGPARDLRLLGDLRVCGAPGYTPAVTATDRLTFIAAMPEYVRARDLSTYPDVATARAAAADLVSAYEDCPTFSPDGGETTVTNTVAPADLGQESWAVTQTSETAQFGPMLGQEVVHVVRVGAAVLVAVTNSEGPGAMFPDRLAESVADDAAALEPVVAAMCDLPASDCR